MHSMPPLGESPLEYGYEAQYEKKTRMVSLPDGEKSLMICLTLSTQYTGVWQTDKHDLATAKSALWICIARHRRSHFDEYSVMACLLILSYNYTIKLCDGMYSDNGLFVSRVSLKINIYTVSQKNCAFLFLSELRQISTNFDKFW